MGRVTLLRAGYALLGISLAALAGSVFVPALVVPALVVAFAGAIVLTLSGDDIPKWAGLALLAYFVVTILVFLVGTPVTIDKGDGYFVNSAPPELADEALYWIGLAAPVVIAGAAIVASWEREPAPRILLAAGAAGFLLVGVLSAVLVPEPSEDAARTQGALVENLFALSASVAAVGAFWSAVRPDEYA